MDTLSCGTLVGIFLWAGYVQIVNKSYLGAPILTIPHFFLTISLSGALHRFLP
jgi:hypothetical protein